jgi:hypothetical protein
MKLGESTKGRFRLWQSENIRSVGELDGLGGELQD